MSCSMALAVLLMLMAITLACFGCPEQELPIGHGGEAGHAPFVCDAQMCGLGGEPREAIETCGRGNINYECRCYQRYCCHWDWECSNPVP